MKKRTIIAIASASILSYVATSFYKRFIRPIYAAAKQWDDEHDLVCTTDADSCTVISTIWNHYIKMPDGETFLFLSKSQITSKYPSWITSSAQELFLPREDYTNLSTRAKFTAKFSLVESKLSAQDKHDFKALGIALFERPITLSREQANLVKEKMISILRKATRK